MARGLVERFESETSGVTLSEDEQELHRGRCNLAKTTPLGQDTRDCWSAVLDANRRCKCELLSRSDEEFHNGACPGTSSRSD